MTKQTKKQTALDDRRMNYPTLLKRQGDDMKDEDMLMMPIQDDLLAIIAGQVEELKRLNAIIVKQADTIQALTLDLHLAGK